MIRPTILPCLFEIRLPTPFPVGDVNVFLAEGDPLTLIDCGVRTDQSYQRLAESLAERGHHVRDLRRLVITHHHVDHLGLARRLVEESGAEVLAHPQAVPWLENPDKSNTDYWTFRREIFHESGAPESVINVMQRVNDYVNAVSTGPVRASATLDEGDSLDMAGFPWRVYHTPGHAGSMICFYQPEMRVLLASDHLLRDISSNPLLEAPEQAGSPRPKRLIDYLREIDRIAALDIQIAYSGHGEPITNVRELVATRLALHEKRAEKLLGLMGGQPKTLYELSRLLFPNAPEVEQFLTLSETQGHLDILERDGHAVRSTRDGVVYWSAT
jgi:glyoxylase-like metal-dependent hydrolase (beta-lactamase superfamily II)